MVDTEREPLRRIFDQPIYLYGSHYAYSICKDNHRTISDSHGTIFSDFNGPIDQLNSPLRNLGGTGNIIRHLYLFHEAAVEVHAQTQYSLIVLFGFAVVSVHPKDRKRGGWGKRES